ncbi:MAG: AI-2E family transporter [Chitinophagaceae bacterium]|nr:MAG: AI-2E family transporter [Chitinophagaceae bacterium]
MEYKHLSRLVYLAAGLFISIWFVHQVIDVLLLIFFAIVITIVLNAPVTRLQQKGMSRTVASLIVFFGMLVMFALIGWMVVPKMITQVKLLITNLPSYLSTLNARLTEWIGSHSDDSGTAAPISPGASQISSVINQVGQYSLNLFSNVLLVIFFFCLVAYMLINPRPLLQLYLSWFPEQKQERASEAFAYASTMTIGWMWSNVVAGLIRAVIVWIFLYFMGIPGVWVWAGVTFFAELIPKIGFYIMAVPPILIAFTVSPTLGLWTAGFYIVLDEIIGDFLIPRIRSKTMKIHPVSLLIMLLLMTAAFGVMGAFIATPLAAFIKAHYEIFFEKKKEMAAYDRNIDRMLTRK